MPSGSLAPVLKPTGSKNPKGKDTPGLDVMSKSFPATMTVRARAGTGTVGTGTGA